MARKSLIYYLICLEEGYYSVQFKTKDRLISTGFVNGTFRSLAANTYEWEVYADDKFEDSKIEVLLVDNENKKDLSKYFFTSLPLYNEKNQQPHIEELQPSAGTLDDNIQIKGINFGNNLVYLNILPNYWKSLLLVISVVVTTLFLGLVSWIMKKINFLPNILIDKKIILIVYLSCRLFSGL